jgi:hypothetical protein
MYGSIENKDVICRPPVTYAGQRRRQSFFTEAGTSEMPNSRDRSEYTDRELLIELGGEVKNLTSVVQSLEIAMKDNTAELQGENGLRVKIGVLEERLRTISKMVWGCIGAVALAILGIAAEWISHSIK